jgi:hypothetical protein
VRDTVVAKVDMDVTYVAMAIHVCCKYLFKVFHLLLTYVASAFIWILNIYVICCSGSTHMLQAYVSNVSSTLHVCYRKCFHIAYVS